jgi:putative transposase
MNLPTFRLPHKELRPSIKHSADGDTTPAGDLFLDGALVASEIVSPLEAQRIAVEDDHSRAVMGYFLSMEYPSSMGIASALHHAFLPKPESWWVMHGLPETLYIDNGKDWISKHIRQVCLHFGIRLLRHEPRHSQAKGKIERLFRTVEEVYIHPLDGAVGSSPQKRPHRVTPELTLAQLRVKIERSIPDYHERKHGTTKQKPRERWEQNLTTLRCVENLADIDHLLKSKEYTVQKYGIHFKNIPYLDMECVLGGYIGRRVTVFFDSRDLSRIRVWGRKNEDDTLRYICTAYPQSSNEHRVTREIMGEHNKERRNDVRKSVRDAQKDGEQVLKAIEELEAKEETASDDPQAEGTTSPPVHVAAQKPVEPKAKHKASARPPLPVVTITTEEDEPDYDALRRKLQRQQRGG